MKTGKPRLKDDRTWTVESRPGRIPRAPGEADLPGDAFGLSGTEQLIVHRLIRGHGAEEIADGLGLSVLTTRLHIKRIFARLDVHSRDELFARLGGHLVH